ncbi:MAG: B12-binding domain-containing radical SAM protein, partial [Thaumarchaeota archaeon]|nr:B12-binding domain-containing radical SAM protein [Nitrososphaerota archaeon]
MAGAKYVLSADRSQMSNFRFNFLFGFLSSGPVKISPEPLYSMICPTDDTYNHESGEMTVAPLGLRRVQASLQRAFGTENVVAQHPYMIENAIGDETKVVGLTEMSPLGMGPVDTAISWSNTPWNRMWFTRLMKRLKSLKERYRFKVVVGGPGSWQLLERNSSDFSIINARIDRRLKEELGVDYVVEGEADKLAPEIFERIESGNAPEVMRLLTNSILEMEDIPEIREPTLTSVVECMRGCGRGCEFCAPNLRKKRDFPPERVAREASVNIRHGYKAVWLQTEELTLYGCDSKDKWPNKDAILELYTALNKAGAQRIGATHWTFAGVRAAPDLVEKLAKVNGLDRGEWMGVQPGLEYASPRLVRKFMPYKVKPFSPEEYPETITEGIRIMNRYHYYPACTLIVGAPEEEPDEVQMTIDLIEILSKKEGVHGIFAPLLYVDYY